MNKGKPFKFDTLAIHGGGTGKNPEMLKPGDEMLAFRTIYGSSYNVINKVLPRYRLTGAILGKNWPTLASQKA